MLLDTVKPWSFCLWFSLLLLLLCSPHFPNSYTQQHTHTLTSHHRHHVRFEGRNHRQISPMENRQLRTLLLQEIRSFQARNLELVGTPNFVNLMSLCCVVSDCAWIVTLCACYVFFLRFMSIERNRYLYIHIFPEPSRLSKEQPPVARFILRVSNSSGPTRKVYISPGLCHIPHSLVLFPLL